MANITSRATKDSLKIYIDGHLHVTILSKMHGVVSYIDEFEICQYHIDILLDKGVKMSLEYEERDVWEAMLKELDKRL